MEDGRRREELRRAGNGGWVEEAERLRRRMEAVQYLYRYRVEPDVRVIARKHQLNAQRFTSQLVLLGQPNCTPKTYLPHYLPGNASASDWCFYFRGRGTADIG